MAQQKKLMKIESIKLGYGGYQDAMFGLTVVFAGQDCGCTDFNGFWSQTTKCTDNSKWDEIDRSSQFDVVMRQIDQLLINAKKRSLNDLINVPVEVVFLDSRLESWRILTEVI